MSTLSNRRFASLANGRAAAWLLRVLAAGTLLCSLCVVDGWGAESRRFIDHDSIDRVALEIRRLPAVGTLGDDISAGSSAQLDHSRAGLPALQVSTQDWTVSDDASLSPEYEPRLYLGYDRGFVLAADRAVGDDPDQLDFLMRINSWFHLRHTLFDSDGPNPDQNTFSFERLRLSFAGHVFSPDLEYYLQFDGNSDSGTNAVIQDCFVTYDLGHDVFGWNGGEFGIKVGKWKVPFSRSREETGRQLQFVDRATANVFFDLNRSIGLGLFGRLETIILPVHFETAVFNGFETGSTSTNRDGGLNRNFGWSLRSHTDLFSEFGSDGEPDLSWHCLPALRLGGGLAYSRIDREGESEFRRQTVVDSGATLASVLPDGVDSYGVWLCTVDAHLKYRGLSVIVDYFWRYITDFRGGSVPALLDDGFVLQAGYFLVPEHWEVLARWSRIAGDSGTLGAAEQSFDELGAGLVWYIRGHNAKVTFDATHLNGAPLSESRLDIIAGDAGWLFRTQLQLAF